MLSLTRWLTHVGFLALPDRLNIVLFEYDLQVPHIASRKQCKRDALAPHPCGSARSVRVSLRIHGKIIVDHVADMAEVQPPARHIRRNHELYRHLPETIEK
jgi:hypothetical protein